VSVSIFLCVCVCLSACRVNDLVQLASSATLTTSHVNVTDSQQDSLECHEATSVTNVNTPTLKPMNTSTPAQPNNVASHPSDNNLTPTSSKECSRLPSCASNDITSVKLPAVVIETHVQNYTDVPTFAQNVQSTEEAAVIDSPMTQSQTAASLFDLSAAHSSNALSLCSAKASEENVSTINSISPADLAAPCVSSVTLLISELPPVKDASLGEVVGWSSSVAKVHPASETAATVSSDGVVSQASNAVCDILPVTTSAPGTSVSGSVITAQTSTPPASSVSTKVSPHNQLTLAAGQQPLLSADKSSPVVSSSEIPIHQLKHGTEMTKSSGLTTSKPSRTAVTTVTATRGCTSTSVTGAINVLTSLMRRKSMPGETFVDTTTSPVSKKRPQKLISPQVPPNASEPEDNRPKRAKLDQSVDVVSAVTEPPVENKNISSADKGTGLSDTERISCYKTIGARKELENVIGLRAGDQLHRKTSLARTAAAVSEVDSSKSTAVTVCDESNSNGSSSSPKKPARRVPLITVSTGVPSTPTVFTLRSRARLAQLQQKESSLSQDCVIESVVKSQSRIAQTSGHERSSTQTDVDGNFEQTASAKAANSSNQNKPSSSILSESAIPKAALPQGPDKSKHSLELQNHQKDRQSRSSQKHPRSAISAPSAVPSSKFKMSKPKSAATADESSKLVSSKPASVTSALAGNSSSSVRTLDGAASESDRNRSAAVSRKTAAIAANKKQSNIRTRSSARKGGKFDISETVASQTVRDNLHNHPSNEELRSGKAAHDKTASVSDMKNASQRLSSSGKNTTSVELLKAHEPAVIGSSKILDHNNQQMSQKDQISVAEKRGSKMTKDAGSRDTASSHRKSEPVKLQQVVNESTKMLDPDKRKDTVAEKKVSKITKDLNNKCKPEYTSEQTGPSHDVSNQLRSRAKQTDIISQSSVVTASSQLSVPAVASNRLSTTTAADKNVSPGINGNANRPQAITRMSSRPDMHHAITEKPASVNCKLLTPRKQAVSISFDLSSASKTSSPRTDVSGSGRESVDLFDVAIAGTPAQYPPSIDDSFDSSLMLSPYNADLVDDDVHYDVTSMAPAAEFTIPANPVDAEAVDASLCGKLAVLMMLSFAVYVSDIGFSAPTLKRL